MGSQKSGTATGRRKNSERTERVAKKYYIYIYIYNIKGCHGSQKSRTDGMGSHIMVAMGVAINSERTEWGRLQYSPGAAAVVCSRCSSNGHFCLALQVAWLLWLWDRMQVDLSVLSEVGCKYKIFTAGASRFSEDLRATAMRLQIGAARAALLVGCGRLGCGAA
jgi:hypothetical protein